MRSPSGTALAVRNDSGEILTARISYVPLSSRYPIFRLPFFRGVGALWESLVVGIKALNLSLNLASKEEERLSPGGMVLSMVFALGLVVILFFVLPYLLSRLFSSLLSREWVLIVEGVLRFLIFFAYLGLMSLIPEVRDVLFRYHGAEHKVVHAFEKGEVLQPDVALKYSRLHPRCSTSFLLVVLIVSFILFIFLDFNNYFLRLFSRIFLLPVVAGVSYELIRLFALYPNNFLSKIIILPGLLTQKLTTCEPGREQVEVAIKALEASINSKNA
ncbi:MAG: DUF1385 domain-containing protein [Caldiserica bacterium]|jgi:uncharacterized protein YqhQ|nr:DUF1385 domain-containing protein [Caldisericota bacterium]MDH7562769.1 DUF1385 domain-containing protein [Caldisericota bacterium]